MAEPTGLLRGGGPWIGFLPLRGRRFSCAARRRVAPFFALGLGLHFLGPAGCAPRQRPESPRLLVVVVVDQLRPDLLERYEACFTGGLRRILDRGHHYSNAYHDHAVTNTAPGHATLSTGVVPARHGIVDNMWYERRGDACVAVPCVADSTRPVLGGKGRVGVSPQHLRASTLADWMRAADEASQVVAIGGKDRSSVLLAGAARGHAYWFSRSEGRFVTSSWYRDEYPEWLERFHAAQWPKLSADSVWVCAVPEAQRALARTGPTFTHQFADSGQSFWAWWYDTPQLDGAIVALAQAAVRALALGGDASPDLLALALSQTDIVGHEYGPLSLEQLDNLLRLDRAMGELFDFLDAEVGAAHWLLGLSADHGVTDVPAHQRQAGVDVRLVHRQEVDSLLAALQDLDAPAAAAEAELDRAARLESFDFVAAAMTHAELAGTAPARRNEMSRAAWADSTPAAAMTATAPVDSFLALFRHSYFPGRWPSFPLGSPRRRQSPGCFGVEARLQPWVARSEGAEHGSPYWMDRHVPMLFMGPGIAPGASSAPVRSVDFAPTLARLVGVPVPTGLDGVAQTP